MPPPKGLTDNKFVPPVNTKISPKDSQSSGTIKSTGTTNMSNTSQAKSDSELKKILKSILVVY